MAETFGKMDAARGERCTNPGQDERFTTPCCYADVSEDAKRCPDCGVPIVCEVEQQPVAVCRIADEDEEED
jgi:hypothetical protein